MFFPCAEVNMFHGGTKTCGSMLEPKSGSVLQTDNAHPGADPPCPFPLQCFEPHAVKFQLDGMEPWSQLTVQKKVQENLLGTRSYFEKRVV